MSKHFYNALLQGGLKHFTCTFNKLKLLSEYLLLIKYCTCFPLVQFVIESHIGAIATKAEVCVIFLKLSIILEKTEFQSPGKLLGVMTDLQAKSKYSIFG